MSMMQRIWFSLICLCPVAVVLASLITSFIYPSDRRTGLGFAIVGLLFGIFHVYLALRRELYRRKHGSEEGFRYISGTPLGALFTVLGIVLGFAHFSTAIVGLLAMLIDVNGLPWALVMISSQYDQSEHEHDGHIK